MKKPPILTSKPVVSMEPSKPAETSKPAGETVTASPEPEIPSGELTEDKVCG